MGTDEILSHEVQLGMDSELLKRFTNALKGEGKESEVTHHTIGDLTKYVEMRLRAAVEEYSGGTLLGSNSYGRGLADAVRSAGLAVDERGNDEPLFFLMAWFVDQRNPPHHRDQVYSAVEVAEMVIVGNEILRAVEGNMNRPHPLAIGINAQPAPCPVGTPLQLGATTSLPQLISGAKVEFQIEFDRPRMVKRFEGVSAGPNSWSVTIDTGSLPAGGATVSVVIQAEAFSFRSRRPYEFQLKE